MLLAVRLDNSDLLGGIFLQHAFYIAAVSIAGGSVVEPIIPLHAHPNVFWHYEQMHDAAAFAGDDFISERLGALCAFRAMVGEQYSFCG
ncbi:MAG: hypothetical protein A2Z44_02165 [Betaproteobacteria bacterium RBG_19FT_COMBO_58_11]|nr:MAG: hypothetical protein A2Z44_02165 [Betaproteobacteria bacterium RBG_19FT_COMBO_58_11]